MKADYSTLMNTLHDHYISLTKDLKLYFFRVFIPVPMFFKNIYLCLMHTHFFTFSDNNALLPDSEK